MSEERDLERVAEEAIGELDLGEEVETPGAETLTVDDGDAEEQGGDTDDAQGDAGQTAEPVVVERGRGRVKPSASERFQSLANENRRLQERLDALEQQQRRPSGPTAEQIAQQEAAAEQQLLQECQALDPYQASQRMARYYTERSERRVTQALQLNQIQTWDQNDKANFERELAANPRLQRFEQRVDELRRQAPGVSRLDLLDKAIGEAMRRNLGAARTRQENRASAAAAAHRVQPPRSNTGNVAAERGRGGRQQNFEHMRNVLI